MPLVQARDKRILYIHVPKTGGSSVERYMTQFGPILNSVAASRQGRRCSPQHYQSDLLREIYADVKLDWTFMVVRHPVSRLISQFRYQTRKPNLLRDQLSFSAWLRYVLIRRKLNPYYRDNHFRPQHEFECFDAEVFKLENGLEACAKKLVEITGICPEQKLGWENKSLPSTVTVSDADRELIYQTYAADFERYGYDRTGFAT